MFGRKPRRIDAYELESPDGWWPLPLRQDDEGWVADLAAQGAIEDGVPVLAEMLPAISAEVSRSDAFAAAVWVPEAPEGVVRAVLGLAFVQPDDDVPFTPEQLGTALQDSRLDGLYVHSRDVHLMELGAGDSVLLREIAGSESGGEVEERIVFTVFPPGAGEALELSFTSPYLQSGEELAAHAEAIAMSLRVVLA